MGNFKGGISGSMRVHLGAHSLPRRALSPMIERIKQRLKAGDYRFTIHGFERCVERNISPDEVRHVILSGEVIEEYAEDKYGPSCLICGATEAGRILHIHCSIDPVWIVTAYDPTLSGNESDPEFKGSCPI